MSEPRGLVLQQYVPRLTDRGLEAVEGGAPTLAPLAQMSKTCRAVCVTSWGWFQAPAAVLGGWVSGLVTAFVRPPQAGPSQRSLCDVLLRPDLRTPALWESVSWSVSWVSRGFRAAILQDPRLSLHTGCFGVGQTGRSIFWDQVSVLQANAPVVWDSALRRAGARRDQVRGGTSLSSWLWAIFIQDPRVMPWRSPRPSGTAGTFWLGGHREVGLAAVRGGLTRGLTRAVSWFRGVVFDDPRILIDTHSLPNGLHRLPSHAARTKAVWYGTPLDLVLDFVATPERPRGGFPWGLYIRAR